MTNWTYRRPRSYTHLALLLSLGAVLSACGGEGERAEAAPAEPAAKAAAPDSVVALDSAAVRLAGVELVPVTTAGGDFLTANGTIAFDEDHASSVAPRTEGRVVRVMADMGESVREGQTLALLESADVGQTRGELASAQARMEVAKKNYEREKRLFEEKISSEKEMLEAEGVYRVALADYNSALARLRSVGAGAGQGATYALVAPVGGVVVERNARTGEVVGPEKNLFTVADLRHLWITTDVYESDLPRVRKGAPATVTPRALGDASFPGTVTYAGGVVDPESRTFKVRVEVENESGRLRPGMYATVQIRTTGGGTGQIVVPEIAVQEVNGTKVVFVAGSQPGRFTVRPVTVGPSVGEGRLAITKGLRAGERVVAQGAFQLKAELTKASFGEEE